MFYGLHDEFNLYEAFNMFSLLQNLKEPGTLEHKEQVSKLHSSIDKLYDTSVNNWRYNYDYGFFSKLKRIHKRKNKQRNKRASAKRVRDKNKYPLY